MNPDSKYRKDLKKIYNCGIPWERLNGCSILIAGATGLIGSCLIDVLMENPNRTYSVWAAGRNGHRAESRFSNYFKDKSFHFIQADITQPLPCQESFDFIIHAASDASPESFSGKPVEVIKSNVYGTANLLDHGIIHGMKRFLYVSSGEIYGEGNGLSFNEIDSAYVNCALPRSCYPSSKRCAETLCVSYAAEYGADVVIARPCHTYGPWFTESDDRAYAQFIRNVLKGEDIVLKSPGSQVRSWIYVVDCVSALLFILTKGNGGEAYKIADENSNASIRELAGIIAETAGKEVIFNIGETSPPHITRATFDAGKLRSLGWEPMTSLKEGIEHTIDERKGK